MCPLFTQSVNTLHLLMLIVIMTIRAGKNVNFPGRQLHFKQISHRVLYISLCEKSFISLQVVKFPGKELPRFLTFPHYGHYKYCVSFLPFLVSSRHPTSCCSAAEVMSVLFFHVMKYKLDPPKDASNDRFIMSKVSQPGIQWPYSRKRTNFRPGLNLD